MLPKKPHHRQSSTTQVTCVPQKIFFFGIQLLKFSLVTFLEYGSTFEVTGTFKFFDFFLVNKANSLI